MNWQLAYCNRHINCDHCGPMTDFLMTGLRHNSFLFKAKNNCTYKQLRINSYFWYVTDIPSNKIFKGYATMLKQTF